MTIKELKEWLAEVNPPDHWTIRVAAFGGLRSGKEVERFSVGFDWDQKAVVIHPKQALGLWATIQSKRRARNKEITK